MEWQLAEAKNKFSEVFGKVFSEGPQRIKRKGEVVVLVTEKEFNRLYGNELDFKDFLMNTGPDFDVLNLKRDPSAMREVDL